MIAVRVVCGLWTDPADLVPFLFGTYSVGFKGGCRGRIWVLLPLTNSWIIDIMWLYIALNRIPSIDCYWVGGVPKVECRALCKNHPPCTFGRTNLEAKVHKIEGRNQISGA